MGILNTGGTKALTATTGKTSTIYTTGTPTYITITFNTLGGTPASIEKQVIAGLGQVTPPSPGPTKTGFALIGWSETNGGTTPATFPVVLSAAKTYYAIWEALETVTATFDGLAGATPSSYTAQSGYSPFYVTSPGTPTKTGYNFVGWSPSLPRTITADQTFTAQWSSKQTVITFDPATGNSATNTVATYGLAMSTVGWYINGFGDPVLVDSLTAPTPPQYNTFGGYYDGIGGTGTQYYTAAMASARTWDKTAQEVTLYAKWIPMTATATFDSAGGSPAYTAVTNAIPWTVTSPGTPTKAGYTFSAWSPSLPATITEDTEFTAQWTANTYNITYVLNDSDFSSAYPASHSNPATYTTGSTVNLSVATRSTYTFVGWYDNPSFTGDAITSFVDSDGGDRTFYAKWTPIVSYTITPDKTTVDETPPNNTVTFSVTSQHNTAATLYWTLAATQGIIDASDFSSLSGSVAMTITNALGSGSFVVTLLEDYKTEANDAFKGELRTNSISGTIVKESVSIIINDTSKTKTIAPSFNIMSVGVTQITFRIINNEPSASVTIWYSLDSDPITSGIGESSKVLNISAGGSTDTRAFTGLTGGTTYSLRAVALISSSYNYSDVTSISRTTDCPASGTLLSTYCVGYDKYGTYANGSCGTYSQLIESNSADCGYIQATTPAVAAGVVTQNSVEFTITNNDEDTAVIYWQIRSGSSSGTVVANGYFQAYYNDYETVGYYSASANTTYYLTGVYAEVSGKFDSNMAGVISNTTAYGQVATPTVDAIFCEFSSPTYTLYVTVTNNDLYDTATIQVSAFSDFRNIAGSGSAGSGSNIDIVVASQSSSFAGTSYTYYARAIVSGRTTSSTASLTQLVSFCIAI